MDSSNNAKNCGNVPENSSREACAKSEESLYASAEKCRDLDEYIFRFNLEKTVSER